MHLAARPAEAARSALLPRQPFEAPAGPGAAVVLLVELAFEAVQHVPHFREAGFLERAAGVERAVAAAADEDDRAVDARRLLYVRDEIRVHFPVRAVVPRHEDRARRMPHEQVLHLAAAIDEDRVRILLQELVGLSRLEMLDFRFPRLAAGPE